MKTIYVLYVEVWGGNGYGTELIEAYECPYTANKSKDEMQGKVPKADCCYYVQELEIVG